MWFKMQRRTLMSVVLVVLASSVTDAKCDPPATGLWLIQSYEPTIDFQVPALSGYLKLTRSGENNKVYMGESLVHAPIASVAKFTFQLTGVYDEDSCSLYGSFICALTAAHDTFRWTNFGNGTMAGLYRPMMNVSPQFPKHSIHTLQYQGPIE